VRDLACGGLRIDLDVEVRRVACRRCGTVKQEQLGVLADNSTGPGGAALSGSPIRTWPRSYASTWLGRGWVP